LQEKTGAGVIQIGIIGGDPQRFRLRDQPEKQEKSRQAGA